MKFMQIKPQKARGKFLESMWTDPAYSAENKEDGDRRIAQFCGGLIRFTGTRESVDGTGYVEKSANIPHLSNDWQGPMTATEIKMSHEPARHSPRKMEGTVLDGEIVAPWAKDLPGGESKYVTAVMGSLSERAVALQREHGWLEYRVFDCLWYKGQDCRDLELGMRRLHAKAALLEWKNAHVLMLPNATEEMVKRAWWAKAREGLVFKHEDHTYGDERLWVKLKKEATADVVVMGFEPGKGKYAGSVGAIKFGQWNEGRGAREDWELVEYGTCRGFTDLQMDEFKKIPKKFIGRVFRIKHNGREPTGAFRHPRFDGWRDDKAPKDCVYDPEES